VLLVGKDHFFAGTNCINGKCTKLTIQKEKADRLNAFLEIWAVPEHSQANFVPSLAYHALPLDIVDGHLKQLPAGILAQFSTDNSENGLDQDVLHQESELGDGFFRSFIQDWRGACGPRINLYYLTEDAINNIVALEKSKGLRIFPRYINANQVIDDIEIFVWNNHFGPQMLEAEGFVENISHGFSFQRPGAHHVVADFFDILTADPIPPYGTADDRGAFDHIWKTTHPFHRNGIPKSLAEIFKLPPARDSKRKKLIKSIENAYRDKKFHDHLEETKQSFIEDYLAGVTSRDWCYATVWELVEKYLIQALNTVGRSSTQDRIRCRGIAKSLWEINPTISIGEMVTSGEIQVIGKDYTQRTVHGWICDLAPAQQRKAGRKRTMK
jgi:hypothetical protein